MKERIGIFGGTFNPVHKEHELIVRRAIEELSLNKLIVIPTYVSPHKIGSDVLDAKYRLKMLKIAFRNEKKVEISSYEVEKKGISYTFETIGYYRKMYPDGEIFYLLGSDMLENFPKWKNPELIAGEAQLSLIERKGDNLDNSKLIEIIREKFGCDVLKLEVYGTNCSSTKVRVYSGLNLDLTDLVSIDVAAYINENKLYKGDYLYEFVSSRLPEKRRIHTAGVITTGISLAKKLGADKKKVEIACLLHDVAKYEDYRKYPEFSLDSDVTEPIIHQYLGEYIARTQLKIDDEDILNAIKYHTSGRPGMSLIERIVYISDLIEPSRKYDGVDYLREEINKDFERGFLISLEEINKFLENGGGKVYPLTGETLKYYKNK